MLPARLQDRCNSAHVIGIASASGYTLEFSKPSIDNSGKATLITATDQALHTPGVVFEIDGTDRDALDNFEGAGKGGGYDRYDEFAIHLTDTGEQITASTYLATETKPHLRPYDWYLALVIAGAHHHKLDADHARSLRMIEYLIDTKIDRRTRTAALQALAKHGFDDHKALLKRA